MASDPLGLEEGDFDSEEFSYDSIEPRKKRVRIGNKKYILMEASAEAGAKYKSMAARSARMEDGKVVGVDNIGEIEPHLVSMCLAETTEDGKIKMRTIGSEQKPVTVLLARVNRIPNNIVTEMFEWIKTVSKLGDDDTEESIEKRIKSDTEKLAKLRETRKAREGNGRTPSQSGERAGAEEEETEAAAESPAAK